jgi:hypothetical protein
MTKYSNYKDYKLRIKKEKIQKDIFLLKSFLLNKKNPKKIQFKIMLKLNKIYCGSIGNKLKNRCIFSTKIRSVYRLTNLTKSSFRENLR